MKRSKYRRCVADKDDRAAVGRNVGPRRPARRIRGLHGRPLPSASNSNRLKGASSKSAAAITPRPSGLHAGVTIAGGIARPLLRGREPSRRRRSPVRTARRPAPRRPQSSRPSGDNLGVSNCVSVRDTSVTISRTRCAAIRHQMNQHAGPAGRARLRTQANGRHRETDPDPAAASLLSARAPLSSPIERVEIAEKADVSSNSC